MKGDAKLFVFEVADSGNEIFFQEICGTFRDLNGKLNIGLGNDLIEVGPGRDEDIWDLRFDRDQATNTILKRCEIPFDINIHVGSACIDHWIPFKDRHVLHFKDVFLYCGLKNSQIDGLPGAQFARIELASRSSKRRSRESSASRARRL